MGFQTMGRRRPLSRFMFGVAFLIWMASTVLLKSCHCMLLFIVYGQGLPNVLTIFMLTCCCKNGGPLSLKG